LSQNCPNFCHLLTLKSCNRPQVIIALVVCAADAFARHEDAYSRAPGGYGRFRDARGHAPLGYRHNPDAHGRALLYRFPGYPIIRNIATEIDPGMGPHLQERSRWGRDAEVDPGMGRRSHGRRLLGKRDADDSSSHYDTGYSPLLTYQRAVF
jgi:hypothetical protein